MAIHIENLEIKQFRGIQELSIPSLNHINLIAGDNNCGKTSFLEALLLLRNPQDFINTLRIARMRDSFTMFGGASLYENLLALFPHNAEIEHSTCMIDLYARCNAQEVGYILKGNTKNVMLDSEEQKNIFHNSTQKYYSSQKSFPTECQAFQGKLMVSIGDNKEEKDITFYEYSNVSGWDIPSDRFLNMVYLAPFDHLRGGLFSRVLEDESYKNLCVNILQLFDPSIIDLLLLKNESTNRPVECIKHKNLGIMPLSTYGDGVKKVLSIASAIANAVDGILLIDEVETAIHSRYFDKIFSFIVAACLKFNVQVFITSHSIEAIDAFLSIQNYETDMEKEDIISVVTLKKDMKSFRSYARVLSGYHVYQNREQFGFEVRL